MSKRQLVPGVDYIVIEEYYFQNGEEKIILAPSQNIRNGVFGKVVAIGKLSDNVDKDYIRIGDIVVYDPFQSFIVDVDFKTRQKLCKIQTILAKVDVE